MIGTFKSKALAAYWDTGDASKIRPDQVERVYVRLSAIASAAKPEALNVPGFNFHRLRGKPVRYSIHVNGPWCITFGWDGEEAVKIDLEQYH